MAKKVMVLGGLPKEAMDLLNSQKDIEIIPLPEDGNIKDNAKGCVGILCTLIHKINKEVVDAVGPQLKTISTFSVGYDHIDIDYCKQKGLTVGYTPGVLAKTTAETAVALSFCASRQLIPAVDSAREGTWGAYTPLGYCGKDIYGSTVGIIGMGAIGYEYAKMMKGLGCNIIYSSRNRKPEIEKELEAKYLTREEVLQQADIVSIHCSYSSDTHHLINKDTLKMMKKGSILINTSRGATVDQDALVEYLNNGHLYSAGLDVTTPEPLPTNHPLFKIKNCVIFPHVGSASFGTRGKMAEIAAKNLLAGIRDEKLLHSVY